MGLKIYVCVCVGNRLATLRNAGGNKGAHCKAWECGLCLSNSKLGLSTITGSENYLWNENPCMIIIRRPPLPPVGVVEALAALLLGA